MYVLGMYVSPPPSPPPSPRGRFGRLLLSVGGGYPATGFSRSSVDSRPRRFVARTVLSHDNIGTFHQHLTFRLSNNQQNPKPTFDLARRASRLPNYILQCSFFFFARMSCSEQSAFHGQAADPVWFFSELLFQSVAAKKRKKEKNIYWFDTSINSWFFKFFKISIFLFSSRPTRDQRDQRPENVLV